MNDIVELVIHGEEEGECEIVQEKVSDVVESKTQVKVEVVVSR